MNVNNTVPEELKVIVERAVRPVQANMARKRKMREELLTHLVSVFEEEAEKLSDERTALQRAKTRFGDPKELSRQLQGTVPAWSRFRFLLEKLRLEPGESLLHFAGKMVSFTFLSWAALIVLLLPRLTTVWQVSQTGPLCESWWWSLLPPPPSRLP